MEEKRNDLQFIDGKVSEKLYSTKRVTRKTRLPYWSSSSHLHPNDHVHYRNSPKKISMKNNSKGGGGEGKKKKKARRQTSAIGLNKGMDPIWNVADDSFDNDNSKAISSFLYSNKPSKAYPNTFDVAKIASSEFFFEFAELMSPNTAARMLKFTSLRSPTILPKIEIVIEEVKDGIVNMKHANKNIRSKKNSF